MIKLVKNGATKILSPESSLIKLLKHEGWSAEGEEAVDAPRRGRPPKVKEQGEE